MRLLFSTLVMTMMVEGMAAQGHLPLNDSTQAVQPVVDVRALARQQIEMAKSAQQSLEARQNLSVDNGDPLLLILFLTVALLGTTGALWLTMRRPRRKSVPVTPPPSHTAQQQTPREDPVDALLRQAHVILLEKKAQRTLHAQQRSHPINTSVAMARTLGLGKGELMLAQKLESSTSFPWEQKMRRGALSSGEVTPASARELGLGTGELKLAHTLHAMQEQERKGRP